MKPRRKRAVRPPPRFVRVTARDRQVVMAIARAGYLTTHQLTRLFFAETSLTSRRMAKLVAAGLVDVLVGQHLDEPNAYALRKSGIALAEELGLEPADIHVAKLARALDRHLVAINDVRVALALAERRGEIAIEAFHSDLDLRRAAGTNPPTYLPDAIVELRTAEGTLAYVVEVDLGTESVATFAGKLRVLREAEEHGDTVWGHPMDALSGLLFAPGKARLRSLAGAIEREGPQNFWFVATLDTVINEGLGGDVLIAAEDMTTVRASATPDTAPPLRFALPRKPEREP